MEPILSFFSEHDALCSLAALLCVTFLLWIYSVYVRNVTVVDTFWSLGFLLQGLVHTLFPNNLYNNPDVHWKQFFVLSLVAIWALRLAIYLHIRNHGGAEDARYAAIRKQNSPGFEWKSLFYVFWLQAILNWVIGQSIRSAVISTSHTAEALTLLELAAFSVFFTGLFFEVIGDLELYMFKSNPKNHGKLLTTGLRQYTRHPNYFGNALIFWGFYLFSVATGDYSTIYAPVLMTFLLLKVSGVSLLEKSMKKSKPGWDEYVASTSAFFPSFPRKVGNQ